MNKKGAEKYLSWFNVLVWIMVFVVFVSAIYIFGKTKADIRQEEAKVLAKKIADCVKDKIFFSKEDILQKCGLSKEVIENSGKFYFKIETSDWSGKPAVNPIEIGNSDLFVQCQIKTSEENLPACYTTRVFLVDNAALQNRELFLTITTASNNV